jgi:hypothetical protein
MIVDVVHAHLKLAFATQSSLHFILQFGLPVMPVVMRSNL